MSLQFDQATARAIDLKMFAGSVWRRDEKRFRGRQRYARIEFVCLGGKRVRIQGCKKDGTIPAGSRSTEVDADRFNRRGGFLPVTNQ